MVRTPERLVLIVEHDVWTRWMLRALFEQAGCDVVCASNGVGGLRRAVELRPRLIVLGEALPEISAGEVAEELRAVHHFGRLQIVTVTEILGGSPPEEPPIDAVAGWRTPSRMWSAIAVAQKADDVTPGHRTERVAELATGIG